jgi:hypothetical protein
VSVARASRRKTCRPSRSSPEERHVGPLNATIRALGAEGRDRHADRGRQFISAMPRKIAAPLATW